MVRIAVFGKQGCAKCTTTKHKLSHFMSAWKLENKVEFVFHDMDTVDGRAEGMFYDVMDKIPVTVVEKDGRPVARWEGDVPNSQEIKLVLEEGVNVPAH